MGIIVRSLKIKGIKVKLFGTSHQDNSIKDRLKNEINSHDIVLIETAGYEKLKPENSIGQEALNECLKEGVNVNWSSLDSNIDTEKIISLHEKNPFLTMIEDADYAKRQSEEEVHEIIEDDSDKFDYYLKVMEERDFRFFLSIAKEVREGHSQILAIMGASHIPGVVQYLQNEDYTEIIEYL